MSCAVMRRRSPARSTVPSTMASTPSSFAISDRGLRTPLYCIADVLAQPLHRVVQALLEVNESVCRPDLLLQFVAGNDLARMLQQHLQNLQGLFLKFDLDPALAKFAGTEVRLEYSESSSCSP